MINDSEPAALGSLQSATDTNAKLNRVVAEWWRSALYLQENRSRFEPNELEAYEYILATPERGTADEDRFGTAVNLLREIKYQYADEFGEAAGNFAGKSGKLLRNIPEFAQLLDAHKRKAAAVPAPKPKKRSTSASGVPVKKKSTAAITSRIIRGNVWDGTFDEKGIPYGSGAITYADGSVYTGQWSVDGPHGNGVLIQADGDKWEAMFRNGKPVDGKILYVNGNSYEGGLNENGRHGIGKTSTQTYEEHGQYEDDSRVGKGKITFTNGDFYEGGWNDKGPHGLGRLVDSVNHRTDTGEFVNGKRYGSGRMVWNDTNVCYEGTWFDTPNGMQGQGFTYVLPNGRRSPVTYKDGQPVRIQGAAPPRRRVTKQPVAKKKNGMSASVKALLIIFAILFFIYLIVG